MHAKATCRPAARDPLDNFLAMGQQFMGLEPHLATESPYRALSNADTQHARICPRGGGKVSQELPLLHSVSRVLIRLAIARTVEGGVPFKAERVLQMHMIEPP